MDKDRSVKRNRSWSPSFFCTAPMTFAAAQLGMIGTADAQPSKSKLPSITPQTNPAPILISAAQQARTQRDPYSLCVDGRSIGRDPDPNVRAHLLEEGDNFRGG